MTVTQERTIVERRELHAQRTGRTVTSGAFSPRQLWQSMPEAVRKLDPRTQLRNPVMFVVWVGSVLVTGLAMLFGRFVPILAVLALAGSLAAQKRVAPGAGTLPTNGPLFGVLVAALTFFPALALGPIAEALA